jgi:small subunit ribosomal protein S17
MKERRKVMIGRVVSDKMQKTVVVTVERLTRHPLYGKVIRQRSQFKAHDENNDCKIGDLVRIRESRPISRDKSWTVIEIVEHGK